MIGFCIFKGEIPPCRKAICHKCRNFLYNKEVSPLIYKLCHEETWYSKHSIMSLRYTHNKGYVVRTLEGKKVFDCLEEAIKFIS